MIARSARVALILVFAACHHATPLVLAPTRAQDRAALPPYGGIVWMGDCHARLAPASRAEMTARRAAMATWAPGAEIQLSRLGDRARVVHFAGRAEIPRNPAVAKELARDVITAVAPLLGVATHIGHVAVEHSHAAWFVELELEPVDAFIADPSRHAVSAVVRINRATGDIRVGLVDDLRPKPPACRPGAPLADLATVRARLVGHPLPHHPDVTIAAVTYLDEPHVGVAALYGTHGVADAVVETRDSTGADLPTSRLVLDPVTSEVLAELPLNSNPFDPADPILAPRAHAEKAGVEPRRPDPDDEHDDEFDHVP